MNWQDFISIAIAAVALWLSFKVYQRQKSFENENHFFVHKMEQYQVIIQHTSQIHDFYYEGFMDIKEHMSNRSIDQEAVDAIANAMDEEARKFRLILYKHASFIPQEIVAKLDEFYNSLYDEWEKTDEDIIPIPALDAILVRLEKYEDDLEKIVNLMRKDLGIEVIDRKLKNRTHK